MRWVLGERPLARARAPFAWAPRPGKHTLALVDGAGSQLDAVTFEVRGDRSRMNVTVSRQEWRTGRGIGRAAVIMDNVGPSGGALTVARCALRPGPGWI